jgi:hypothetical protein
MKKVCFMFLLLVMVFAIFAGTVWGHNAPIVVGQEQAVGASPPCQNNLTTLTYLSSEFQLSAREYVKVLSASALSPMAIAYVSCSLMIAGSHIAVPISKDNLFYRNPDRLRVACGAFNCNCRNCI